MRICYGPGDCILNDSRHVLDRKTFQNIYQRLHEEGTFKQKRIKAANEGKNGGSGRKCAKQRKIQALLVEE